MSGRKIILSYVRDYADFGRSRSNVTCVGRGQIIWEHGDKSILEFNVPLDTVSVISEKGPI